MPRICPQCQAPLQTVGRFSVCPEHGPVESTSDGSSSIPASKPTRPKVFISYGRRDARALVDRLCVDLAAAGFDVWRDTREIRAGADWQAEIVDGLRSAQVVVAVMTPHSVRTSRSSPDGIDSVCLSEIAYAQFQPPPRPVVPVLAETCEPPLTLFHLDYVDLRSWTDSDDQYRAGLERLLDALRAALRGETRHRSAFLSLRAFDFADFLFSRRRHFVGRRWLLDAIDAWRADPGGRPALLVSGDPGVGKSAVVAELVHQNPDGQVLAYHCCQWNLPATLDARRFVRSLAAMLAAKLDRYSDLLLRDESLRAKLLDDHADEDPRSLFSECLLSPLQALEAPESGLRYLLIDALDEALLVPPGRPTILDVLSACIERLPPWLRIVATTRNEPLVLSRLRGLRPTRIDAGSEENLDDLRSYLRLRLWQPNLQERLAQARRSPDAVELLLAEKSDGNFLYVRQALDDLESGVLSADQLTDLPPGLSGLYENRFAAQFPDEAGFTEPERLFEVLAAAREPLEERQIAGATGLEPRRDLPRLLTRLQQHLRVLEWDRSLSQVPPPSGAAGSPRRYTFFHKSLIDWLAHPDRRGLPRSIDPVAGHERLAAVGWSEYAQGASRLSPYSLQHLPAHLIAAGRWDDLARLLTDVEYLEARNAAGQVFALAVDLSAAWQSMPEMHPLRRLVRLIDEALRRDIQFIHRHREDHPQALFQSLWNHGWWYDAPEAGRHYEGGRPPGADAGVGLHTWLEQVRERRERDAPGFLWVRALRPPAAPLGSPLRQVLRGHGAVGLVNCAAFSPDGRRIASGSDDKRIRLWDAATGAELAALEGHDNPVGCLAFTPDGRRIISRSNDVRIWDATTGDLLEVLLTHPKGAPSEPSHRFDSASAHSLHGDVQVWRHDSGEPAGVLREHEYGANRAALSLDRRWIVCVDNRAVRVLDSANGTERSILHGHADSVYCVAISPDGLRIASGSVDRTIRVWDVASGQTLAVFRGHDYPVTSVAFSPDGAQIVSAAWDGTVRIWDATTSGTADRLVGPSDDLMAVAFSPDGTRIATGSDDDELQIWDAESGTQLAVYDGQEWGARCVAWSPDGARIAVGSGDSVVRVRDAATGEILTTLRGHRHFLESVAFSPDGGRIVSSSRDRTARVWDVESGAEVYCLEGHTDDVTDVRWSPDGAWILTVSDDGTLRAWDAGTGECRGSLDDQRLINGYLWHSDADWRAAPAHGETVVIRSGESLPRAWYPESLLPLSAHPSCPQWAGARHGHLHLISLEGNAAVHTARSPSAPP